MGYVQVEFVEEQLFMNDDVNNLNLSLNHSLQSNLNLNLNLNLSLQSNLQSDKDLKEETVVEYAVNMDIIDQLVQCVLGK